MANARAVAVNELAGYLRETGKDVYTFESLGEAYDFGLKLRGDIDYLFCVALCAQCITYVISLKCYNNPMKYKLVN